MMEEQLSTSSCKTIDMFLSMQEMYYARFEF